MSDPHDPVAQTITLAPIPPETLVVCGANFLHSIAECERDIAGLKVTDAATAQQAADLQGRLTSAGKRLEEMRAKLKAPFLAKGREIDDAAKAPATRIDTAKRAVSTKLVEFKLAQDKLAREQEAERVAAAAKPVYLDLDDAAPAPVAVVAPVEKPAGVVYRTRLLIAATTLNKLPDEFVIRTANIPALRAKFCVPWADGDPVPACPGVEFGIDRMVVSDGKREEF